jgi:hypothetical protein
MVAPGEVKRNPGLKDAPQPHRPGTGRIFNPVGVGMGAGCPMTPDSTSFHPGLPLFNRFAVYPSCLFFLDIGT